GSLIVSVNRLPPHCRCDHGLSWRVNRGMLSRAVPRFRSDRRLTQTPYNSGSLRKVSSNRKRVGNQAGLLAFVAGECADSRGGAGVASRVGDFAAKERAQSRFDESPCAHVLRFFLAPHELRAFWKWLEHFAQLFFREWVKLLDANDRLMLNLAPSAILQPIVIPFAVAT